VHVTVTVNGRPVESSPGQSLFACAERAGIRVPTSCRTQGRCKECIVEITAGMDLLSAPTEEESHLKGQYRLSCQCRVAAAEGDVRCHTMRRGQMRIERRAPAFAASRLIGPIRVTRDGDRVDRRRAIEGRGALHGIAMDLGTSGPAPPRLGNRGTLADTSFKPAALRRVRRHGAHPAPPNTAVTPRAHVGRGICHATRSSPSIRRRLRETVAGT
jgi:ferredoxin